MFRIKTGSAPKYLQIRFVVPKIRWARMRGRSLAYLGLTL